MVGASIEATLELWSSSLRDVKARMRPLFRRELAASAERFLDGLLGEERRKTGWMGAEAAGDPGPWRQQAILGRDWDADALRDIVRDYALGDAGRSGCGAGDRRTGFLKQGKASCGVARQYTGSAGGMARHQHGADAFRDRLNAIDKIEPIDANEIGRRLDAGFIDRTLMRMPICKLDAPINLALSGGL